MYFEFESAVRGYHYYRRFWTPSENETLKCFHERRNPFDVFAIKTCSNGNSQAVGHLPREISRLTKFILDRGAEVEATLASTQYRRSPITQGGLEIPCVIKVTMPGTMLNKKLLNRYEEMATQLYKEPEESAIMGSFVFDDIVEPSINEPKPKKKKKERYRETASRDIRSMFGQDKKKIYQTGENCHS